MAAAGLPVSDLPADLAGFRILRDGSDPLIGFGGLEIQAGTALLRSVVVDPGRRGDGAGGRIVAALIADARDQGVENIYLLTETAAAFFAKQGFVPVDRADVPDAIRQTDQFAGLCPASATAMVNRRIR